MTASTESDPVLDILGDVTKMFGSLFDQMDWAEEGNRTSDHHQSG
ncbi:hypothetical protein [Prauserella sp. PE36]|nr:hypothetical protein [Prauserella sp. PE36]